MIKNLLTKLTNLYLDSVLLNANALAIAIDLMEIEKEIRMTEFLIYCRTGKFPG